MTFSVADLEPREVYKLLTATIVPRPIALVTSKNENGLVNAAPFSFFNIVGADPPLIVLGVGNRAPGEGKDTARNIRANGEFVVNLVDENLAAAMNVCAVDFPSDWSEIEAADLELCDSKLVKVPRLKASPVALECREVQTLEIGRNRVIMGEIVAIWIREEFVNANNFHISTPDLKLIGRMGGAGGYVKTSDTFEMARLSFEQWQADTARE